MTLAAGQVRGTRSSAIAWLGSMGAILVAAWQAGRVSPADALRGA